MAAISIIVRQQYGVRSGDVFSQLLDRRRGRKVPPRAADARGVRFGAWGDDQFGWVEYDPVGFVYEDVTVAGVEYDVRVVCYGEGVYKGLHGRPVHILSWVVVCHSDGLGFFISLGSTKPYYGPTNHTMV